MYIYIVIVFATWLAGSSNSDYSADDDLAALKSAHTALAVKACLLGGKQLH